MKGILKFNLDDPLDLEEFGLAQKGRRYEAAIEEIGNDIFRPARKHGYSHPKLQNLSEETLEAISILEEMYYQILEERGVK